MKDSGLMERRKDRQMVICGKTTRMVKTYRWDVVKETKGSDENKICKHLHWPIFSCSR